MSVPPTPSDPAPAQGPSQPGSGLLRILVPLLAVGTLSATTMMLITVLGLRGHQQPAAPDPAISQAEAGLTNSEQALPVLRELTDFSLTERSGRTLTLADLRGKVTIASFIFTRCGGTCPRMTTAASQVAQKLQQGPMRDRVQLLSVSVDPEFDTPEVLQQYAQAWAADPKQWLFATGPRDAVLQVIRHNFLQAVEATGGSEKEPIIHSTRFVLIDKQGRIRGLYAGISRTLPDGTAMPDEREQLLKDVHRLLRESPAPTASTAPTAPPAPAANP